MRVWNSAGDAVDLPDVIHVVLDPNGGPLEAYFDHVTAEAVAIGASQATPRRSNGLTRTVPIFGGD